MHIRSSEWQPRPLRQGNARAGESIVVYAGSISVGSQALSIGSGNLSYYPPSEVPRRLSDLLSEASGEG